MQHRHSNGNGPRPLHLTRPFCRHQLRPILSSPNNCLPSAILHPAPTHPTASLAVAIPNRPSPPPTTTHYHYQPDHLPPSSDPSFCSKHQLTQMSVSPNTRYPRHKQTTTAASSYSTHTHSLRSTAPSSPHGACPPPPYHSQRTAALLLTASADKDVPLLRYGRSRPGVGSGGRGA